MADIDIQATIDRTFGTTAPNATGDGKGASASVADDREDTTNEDDDTDTDSEGNADAEDTPEPSSDTASTDDDEALFTGLESDNPDKRKEAAASIRTRVQDLRKQAAVEGDARLVVEALFTPEGARKGIQPFLKLVADATKVPLAELIGTGAPVDTTPPAKPYSEMTDEEIAAEIRRQAEEIVTQRIAPLEAERQARADTDAKAKTEAELKTKAEKLHSKVAKAFAAHHGDDFKVTPSMIARTFRLMPHVNTDAEKVEEIAKAVASVYVEELTKAIRGAKPGKKAPVIPNSASVGKSPLKPGEIDMDRYIPK